MLVKRPKSRIGYADVSDLQKDQLVQFQHRYYPWFALLMGFLFPTLVAGLGWNDYKVNLFYFFKKKITTIALINDILVLFFM